MRSVYRQLDGIRCRLVLRKEILLHTRNAVFIWPVINRWCHLEISVPWRRRQGPLQCGRIPGILGCLRPFEHAVKEIDEKWNRRKAQPKRAQSDEYLQRLLATQMVIQSGVGDAPHHAVQAQIMHREKREIEKHEREDEMHFAPKLVHHPTKHFWIPKVDARENPKEAATEKHVVNVSNNKVGVMNKEIHRSRSHIDAA